MPKQLSWEVRLGFLFLFFLVIITGGCGSKNPMPAITISPDPVSFASTMTGTVSNTTVVTVMNPGTSALTISSITKGGANPGDFSDTTTCNGALASGASCTVSVTFAPTAPGQRSSTIALTDNAPNSPQVINLSGTATAIAVTIAPASAAVGTGQATQFSATSDSAGVTWSVSGGNAGGPGTIDGNGVYTAPLGSSTTVTVTATSKTSPASTSSATVNVVAPGTFAPTNNKQVASYTVSPAAPANVSVQFGLTTSYGLNTWTQPAPANGGPVSLFVAGMKPTTSYHMRGVVQFADGSTFNDADYVFTTGALPSGLLPTITTTTTPGMTPQSGVEMVNTASNVDFVTDLAGNVLWYLPVSGMVIPNPIKLLSNGHFLVNLSGQPPDGTNSVIEEVDLGNNVIWQMTAAQLNAALATAPCAGCNLTVVGTHHDFALLPNGHLIVIASAQKLLSDNTTATGDVVIDLGDMENVSGSNPTHTPLPVWLWNEFDNLDTNRRPFAYPDWTHSNAILYSPDDGNLIISIRHQSWLVKMDYSNGTGDGHVIWKLGFQGDFTLLDHTGAPDTNAADWFFAQHGPSFTSTNTAGNFSMILFDNGDLRNLAIAPGTSCGATGQPACYSTVPLLNIDEAAKTATLVMNPTTPDYSFFGGNAEILKNGDVEFTEAASVAPPVQAGAIFEVLQSDPSQQVWQMQVNGKYVYRGFRMPSLYPGVQW